MGIIASFPISFLFESVTGHELASFPITETSLDLPQPVVNTGHWFPVSVSLRHPIWTHVLLLPLDPSHGKHIRTTMIPRRPMDSQFTCTHHTWTETETHRAVDGPNFKGRQKKSRKIFFLSSIYSIMSLYNLVHILSFQLVHLWDFRSKAQSKNGGLRSFLGRIYLDIYLVFNYFLCFTAFLEELASS